MELVVEDEQRVATGGCNLSAGGSGRVCACLRGCRMMREGEKDRLVSLCLCVLARAAFSFVSWSCRLIKLCILFFIFGTHVHVLVVFPNLLLPKNLLQQSCSLVCKPSCRSRW